MSYASFDSRNVSINRNQQITYSIRCLFRPSSAILFPAAERALPPAVLEKLPCGFEEFERNAMGEGVHLKLHVLGVRLLAEYPPSVVA
jgi:hypothetical protein